MELQDWDGDLFANIAKVNNVYPVKRNVIPPKAGFATWTTEGEDPSHEELVERLRRCPTNGANSMRATLMTRHRWLGHPSFKTAVALAESGAGGMVIADLPKKIPGLGALDVLQRNR